MVAQCHKKVKQFWYYGIGEVPASCGTLWAGFLKIIRSPLGCPAKWVKHWAERTERKMAKLRIHPIPLFKMFDFKGRLTYMVDIAQPAEACVYVWYIEGTKERVLVDAGSSVEGLIRHGFRAEAISSLNDGLKRVGVSPEEVDLIICTHLHIDHIEFGHLYKNAKFIVQAAELEGASNPHPAQAPQRLPKGTLEGLNFQVIKGDTQILDGIRVLFSPGHTKGGQSVVVDTEKGKVVISGLCTIRENFEPPAPLNKIMPVIPTGSSLDTRQSFDSLMRIKEEADIIVPLHDCESILRETIP